MKLFPLSILFIATISQVIAMDDEIKRVIDSVSVKATSGDFRSLIAELPSIEKLWEKDPTAYLEAVKIAAPVLRATTDPEIRKSALDTFSNVLNKTAPSETVAATSYFKLKDTIIGGYFNLEEVREDKARLLEVASFLGEVRSRRIPDYENAGTRLPGIEILLNAGVKDAADLPIEAQKLAYAEAIKKNDEDIKMNALQAALFSADRSWMHSLRVYAKAFPPTKVENRDFYHDLAERAKLTKEEIKTLSQPK